MATTTFPIPRTTQSPFPSRPRLLFLDDSTRRIHSALRQYSEKYELTIVANVVETLRQLSSNGWDIVSLDHDLNGYDFQDPDLPTCGMEVVRYLEKTGWPEIKPKPEFWVHSSNIFAANMMVLRLKKIGLDAYWRRFVYDEVVEHMTYDKDGFPK